MGRLQRLATPRLNRYIKHMPHPAQAAFLLLNDHKEVLFGGAVGGGKSDALLMAALQFVDVPGYSALILRTSREALALAGGLIPRSHEWLAPTGARWRDRDKSWTFPGGGTLTFGYLSRPNDIFRYSSSEWQFVGFEELTEFKRPDDYRTLFSRLRRPMGGPLGRVPLRMRATTNPAGPGFRWVKERFVSGPPTPGRVYLPSTLEDNPSLDAEEYRQMLAELSPSMRRRLEKGIWELGSGGDQFDRDDFNIVDASEVPKLLLGVRYWDFAATAPSEDYPDPDWLAGVGIGLDAQGRVWVFGARQDRPGPPGVDDYIKAAAQEDGKKIPVGIEREGGAQAKLLARHYQTQVLRGWDVHAKPATTSKVLRAGPFSSQVRAGNVYVVRNAFTQTFIDQHHAFPDVDHDDLVDAASGGYNLLVELRESYAKKPKDFSPIARIR